MKNLLLALATLASVSLLSAQSLVQAPSASVGASALQSAPLGSDSAPFRVIPVASERTRPIPSPMELPEANPTSSRSLRLGATNELSPLLPLTLPGYELRVMDITKKVTFDINGEPVLAEVPIFIYLPKNPQSIEDTTRELRKLYNELIMMYDQERVDKERVKSMLKRLDGIIDTYDTMTPALVRHSAPSAQ